MELFDWRRKDLLGARFFRDVVPFPHAYVGVNTIELTRDGAQAYTQLAALNHGYMPEGEMTPLRLNEVLTDGTFRDLEHSLTYHFRDGNYAIDWAGDESFTTLHTMVRCDHSVVYVFMNVLNDLKINPDVPDKQRVFAKMETWGNEALDSTGARVGSFYHHAGHQGYDYPWVPGAIAPNYYPVDSTIRFTFGGW